MEPEAPEFATSILTRVAGCEAVTLRAWRNRNGLFPATMGKQGWNRFSLVDVCIARTVVMMTASGIAAGEAIWFAETYLRTPFRLAHTKDLDGDMSGIVAFAPKGTSETATFRLYVEPHDVAAAISEFGGLVTLLDINLIHAQVIAGLEATAEPKKGDA
ncbi:hypothetical protein [Methylobacterium sp. V23]|uniref:hypothetical protein n=1 Tax=Methylobacterium sp. V23 TaxID=2044878 RepID=UPI000CDB75D3|nr:hypothetical protein [Methylobacterium sp. V23]POR40424.1 hypothetical protein CRT23_24170 [Methylobacterium sp. V23]